MKIFGCKDTTLFIIAREDENYFATKSLKNVQKWILCAKKAMIIKKKPYLCG